MAESCEDTADENAGDEKDTTWEMTSVEEDSEEENPDTIGVDEELRADHRPGKQRSFLVFESSLSPSDMHGLLCPAMSLHHALVHQHLHSFRPTVSRRSQQYLGKPANP